RTRPVLAGDPAHIRSRSAAPGTLDVTGVSSRDPRAGPPGRAREGPAVSDRRCRRPAEPSSRDPGDARGAHRPAQLRPFQPAQPVLPGPGCGPRRGGAVDPRVPRLVNALFLALEKRGWPVDVHPRRTANVHEGDRVRCTILGEVIEFS